MLRLRLLVVGSDNLGSLLGLTFTMGADFYFELNLALQRHRRKDGDRDGVSSKYDKYPKQKGSWETKGCPLPAPLTLLAALRLAPHYLPKHHRPSLPTRQLRCPARPKRLRYSPRPWPHHLQASSGWQG
jgi:hypothetical protein